jgi:hypothetical protein
VPTPKLCCELESDLLAPTDFGGDDIEPRKGFIRGRVVGEDHVIDRNPAIKPTLVVEIEYLFNGVRGIFLADICECSAVAHCDEASAAGFLVETKELPYADTKKSVALRNAVFAWGTRCAIHDRLRDKEPVEWWPSEHLMRVPIIAHA